MSAELIAAIALVCQANAAPGTAVWSIERGIEIEARQLQCQSDIIQCIQKDKRVRNLALPDCIVARAKKLAKLPKD